MNKWVNEWTNECMIKDTFHVIEYLRLEISTGGSGGNHRS